MFDAYKTQMEEVISLLKNLNRKIDGIRKILEKREKVKESQKILETKEKIISILKEHKSISPSELSKLIGLSRTRCNEYLKKLENEGLLKSIRVGKKKVYRLKEFI
jgi:DNA-binding transcriptional ArsR family regulator